MIMMMKMNTVNRDVSSSTRTMRSSSSQTCSTSSHARGHRAKDRERRTAMNTVSSRRYSTQRRRELVTTMGESIKNNKNNNNSSNAFTRNKRVRDNECERKIGTRVNNASGSSNGPGSIFDPLIKFNPERVSVSFCEDSMLNDSPALDLRKPRRYTLTHNDLTRHLTLSVSKEFNETQTSIWYTKLLRDEVLAEWREDGLHVFCQVSADGAWWIRWAAPLRAIVFRQKLPLVLDTLRYAERSLFDKHPELLETPVYVNFRGSVEDASADKDKDREYWGILRDAGGRNESSYEVKVIEEDKGEENKTMILERTSANNITSKPR